jgi:hypothetical protein
VDSQRGERERERVDAREKRFSSSVAAHCVVSCRVVSCGFCVVFVSEYRLLFLLLFAGTSKLVESWPGIKEVAGEERTSRTQVRETGEL